MTVTLRDRLRRALIGSAVALGADAAVRRLTNHANVRVLSLHGTPSRDRSRLRDLVAWTKEHFDVVSPSQFLALTGSSAAAYDRSGVLFTFDDGLRSNYDVAAPVLEEHGISALFFIVPGFSSTPVSDHKAFFAARIRDAWHSDPPSSEEYTPMRPADVADLAARGHMIGSHTWSHSNLREIAEADYEREIVRPAAVVREWTGTLCTSFAWASAWNAISVRGWQRVIDTYSACFSVCPSRNWVGGIDTHLVFRTNVKSSMSLQQYRFFVSGLGDPFWTRRRCALIRMKAEVDRR